MLPFFILKTTVYRGKLASYDRFRGQKWSGRFSAKSDVDCTSQHNCVDSSTTLFSCSYDLPSSEDPESGHKLCVTQAVAMDVVGVGPMRNTEFLVPRKL